jgi:hypothetical protein
VLINEHFNNVLVEQSFRRTIALNWQTYCESTSDRDNTSLRAFGYYAQDFWSCLGVYWFDTSAEVSPATAWEMANLCAPTTQCRGLTFACAIEMSVTAHGLLVEEVEKAMQSAWSAGVISRVERV